MTTLKPTQADLTAAIKYWKSNNPTLELLLAMRDHRLATIDAAIERVRGTIGGAVYGGQNVRSYTPTEIVELLEAMKEER